jgi:hypothetical protein
MDCSNKYINEFFNLNCMPDILDILNPISGRKKEITESMAVIKQIRKIVFKHKRNTLFDFCAGNALTSTIASFLFPNLNSYAIDKRLRERDWDRINNFKYIQSDIKKENWSYILHQLGAIYSVHPARSNFIIIGVHPCRDLAQKIIEIYNKSYAEYLILMPCCTGQKYKYSLPDAIREKVGDYLTWCVYLLDLVEGKKRLIVDESILSPKNALIIASRGSK